MEINLVLSVYDETFRKLLTKKWVTIAHWAIIPLKKKVVHSSSTYVVGGAQDKKVGFTKVSLKCLWKKRKLLTKVLKAHLAI